jgi:membrane protease YdiL (CAAX protease family)
MAWTFYLVVALAGGLWIGIARRGPIPLSLFISPRGWWLDLGAGLAAGLALWAVWQLGRRSLPAARDLEGRLASLLGPITTSEAVALALLSGFAEELFFRGAVQAAVGWIPATLLFALLHTGPGRAFRLWTIFALVAGLLLGALMLWRGNLLAPVTAHALVNGINLRELGRVAAQERASAQDA